MLDNLEKILVPVDGSEQAHDAFVQAIQIANRYNAEVEVLAVIHEDTVAGKSALRSGMVFEKLKQEWDELVQSYADEAHTQYNFANVSAYTSIGKPKHEILRIVKDDPKIGLIVIGATGKNALERSFLGLGSVAQYVVREATVPVLVVH